MIGTATIRTIPMYAISPAPVALRQHLDPIGIPDLIEAVASLGDRITVRQIPTTGQYVMVLGETLLAEAKAAGDTEIEAAVLDYSTASHVWRLLAEVARWIGRPGITPLEEAQLFRLLLDNGLPQAAIASYFGKGKGYVGRRVQLLDLCPAGLAALSDGRLPIALAPHVSQLALGRQDGLLNAWFRGDFATAEAAVAFARQLLAEESEGQPSS
ncbi:ParB/RepB/Spo0J family partition protein [Streptomyces goshikiensis]|uniref:ParB/RepB/Spo0J family partition protein n=1 Tax=Streptomyces goshikiensis TaxID=1942 RepID=UPI00366161DF